MRVEVRMPNLGSDMDSGKVVAWLPEDLLIPYSLQLEDAIIPDAAAIARAVRSLPA